MRKLFFTGRISCAAIIGVLALCFHVSNAWGLTASTTVDGGTLSWAVTQFTAPCGPTGSSDTYTQYGLGSFQFNYDGTTYPLNGVSSAYIQDGNQYGCPPSGPQPSALPIPLPSYFGDAHLEFTGESGGYGYATAVSTGTYDPAYKVVSILYAPPGNQSTQGYTVSTTNGTTSTIGDGFTYSQQLTFSSGIPNVLGGSASWGYSTGNSDSQAFTQSWTDATGYVNNDMGKPSFNPNASNVENHNLDLFSIWLNPQVTVVNDNSIPVSYSITSQPSSGVNLVKGDVERISAEWMEATPGSVTASDPTGTSSVPPSYLELQVIQTSSGPAYQPGLASICKNLNVSAYDSRTCTMAGQCGCTPADFAQILTQDPLLNYSASTYTAAPYPGTTDPLSVDKSGIKTCSESVIPNGSNCRYVVVDESSTSTTPEFVRLDGDSGTTVAYSQSNASTFTKGASQSRSVGVSFGGGVLLASLKTQDTWTWSNFQSTASTLTNGNSMNLGFNTATAGCDEEVTLYEDTEFHTFVFQVPTGNFGCN